MNINKPDDATVEDIADMMLNLVAQGKADYVVICNDEYTLAKKGDVLEINDNKETVGFGGSSSF